MPPKWVTSLTGTETPEKFLRDYRNAMEPVAHILVENLNSEDMRQSWIKLSTFATFSQGVSMAMSQSLDQMVEDGTTAEEVVSQVKEYLEIMSELSKEAM